jgi:hypothetical protein
MSDGITDCYSDSNPNSHSDTNGNSHTHNNAYGHTYSHGDADPNSSPYCYSEGYSAGASDAAAATESTITKGTVATK